MNLFLLPYQAWSLALECRNFRDGLSPWAQWLVQGSCKVGSGFKCNSLGQCDGVFFFFLASDATTGGRNSRTWSSTTRVHMRSVSLYIISSLEPSKNLSTMPWIVGPFYWVHSNPPSLWHQSRWNEAKRFSTRRDVWGSRCPFIGGYATWSIAITSQIICLKMSTVVTHSCNSCKWVIQFCNRFLNMI